MKQQGCFSVRRMGYGSIWSNQKFSTVRSQYGASSGVGSHLRDESDSRGSGTGWIWRTTGRMQGDFTGRDVECPAWLCTWDGRFEGGRRGVPRSVRHEADELPDAAPERGDWTFLEIVWGIAGGGNQLLLQIEPGFQLHPPLPCFQGYEMENGYKIRGAGHHG